MRMRSVNSPNFAQGAGMALVVSLGGSALFALFSQLGRAELALQAVITLAAMAYLLFLLRGSPARVGKVTAVLSWSAISGLSWLLEPGLLGCLLVHMGLIWLVRCLYFYHSLLAALMDIALQGLSLAAAIWAMQQTGSLFLCLWSFFLVQALFVCIPPAGITTARSTLRGDTEQSSFRRAHRSAEAALRRLA